MYYHEIGAFTEPSPQLSVLRQLHNLWQWAHDLQGEFGEISEDTGWPGVLAAKAPHRMSRFTPDDPSTCGPPSFVVHV